MLTQNFLPSNTLAISDAEREALIKLLGMFERGELRYINVPDDAEYLEQAPSSEEFNCLFSMDNFFTQTDCGTACCFAGACDVLFGTTFVDSWKLWGFSNVPVRHLFCPSLPVENDWKKITIEQAAIALRNFLTSGDPRWAQATSGKPE